MWDFDTDSQDMLVHYHLQLQLAITTAVLMASIPEIMDTPSLDHLEPNNNNAILTCNGSSVTSNYAGP
jgi:hypothetical protein